MKRIVKHVVIIIIVFILIFYARWCLFSLGHQPSCFICGKPHLIHNYYRAVGIDSRVANNDINVTKEIYGEPIYIESELVLEGKTLYWVFLHYDGFSIIFQTEDYEKYQYWGFELYDPKMKI